MTRKKEIKGQLDSTESRLGEAKKVAAALKEDLVAREQRIVDLVKQRDEALGQIEWLENEVRALAANAPIVYAGDVLQGAHGLLGQQTAQGADDRIASAAKKAQRAIESYQEAARRFGGVQTPEDGSVPAQDRTEAGEGPVGGEGP